jgi:hypothetical protein
MNVLVQGLFRWLYALYVSICSVHVSDEHQYIYKYKYIRLSIVIHNAVGMQPSWSVSTRCNICGVILVRLYMVEFVCSHLDPSLHGAACVHPSYSVSIWYLVQFV